jgi:EAL domain-containing protein (putative c-di-GMP-specific phosphodiesterase class I)
MKVETIAELVEDPHTLAALAELGVDHAQGYQVSQPAPIPVK